MLIFRPSDAIMNVIGGNQTKRYKDGDWWMAYEYFCRKLIEWNPDPSRGSPVCEVLNATSSINNDTFYEIKDIDGPVKRLAYLFSGRSYRCDAFLKSIGIENWTDLSSPIEIQGRRPKIYPNPIMFHGDGWFDIRGRTIKRKFRDKHAKDCYYVQGFGMQFDVYSKRWVAYIHYGYDRSDGRSRRYWKIKMEQNYREFLGSFWGRVDKWIEKVLEPEDDPRERIQDNVEWERRFHAAKELFYDNWLNTDVCEFETILADGGQICITNRRLAVLKRWAKDTAKSKN